MAFDEELAGRIRDHVRGNATIEERRMFGGLCFLTGGRMFAGIVGNDLMAKLGPDGTAAALLEPHVRPMDFTGRISKGMVYIAPAGIASDAELARWLDAAMTFVTAAPPPKPGRPAKARSSS